jgi:hypothetical protein
VEFLEKLAALTPRPEINLVLYHGLAPHARWRPDIVAYRRVETSGETEAGAAMGRTGAGYRIQRALRFRPASAASPHPIRTRVEGSGVATVEDAKICSP